MALFLSLKSSDFRIDYRQPYKMDIVLSVLFDIKVIINIKGLA